MGSGRPPIACRFSLHWRIGCACQLVCVRRSLIAAFRSAGVISVSEPFLASLNVVSLAKGPLEQARLILAIRTQRRSGYYRSQHEPIKEDEIVQPLSVWWHPRITSPSQISIFFWCELSQAIDQSSYSNTSACSFRRAMEIWCPKRASAASLAFVPRTSKLRNLPAVNVKRYRSPKSPIVLGLW